MSRASPLRTNSRRVSFHASPISPHPNSSLANSPPVVGQPGRSNGLPSNRSQSTLIAHGIAENDDVEKQLFAADQAPPVYSDVGTTRPLARPLQGNPNGSSQGAGLSTPSEHLKSAPSNLDQYPDFWNSYNKEADREDSELIKSFAGDLDTLLIFAGLFSATNTAFIVESYKDLKQDSSDLTNNLLRNMMRTIHQSSSFTEADLLLDPVRPSGRSIVVNSFFFASLCCSLFTAFGAVIGKQWLNHYEREGQLKSPSARGMERQKKYMGLTKWKFQAVVETLPTLLQFSLFFFFIGLIDFLWPLNKAVAILVIIFSVFTASFYGVTLVIGILYPNSPFQTRLTAVLRRRMIPKKPAPVMDQNTKMDILRARCVDWLKERTSFSDTIGIVARAVVLLTDDAKKVINLDHGGAMLAYLLRSSVYSGRVYLGISAEGLQSSLIVLQDLITQWDKVTDLVHLEDKGNTYFLQALSRELWNLLLKPGTMDDIATSTALGILEKLGPIKQGDSAANHAEYLVDSLGKPSSRQDQLLRLALLHDAVRSQNHLVVRTYIGKSHMPDVLAATMWGVDKKPDLDHRRVALRLSWFLDDVDGMYPQVKNLNFGRYLSLWRSSTEQPDPLISFAPAVLSKLYLRTVIGLLSYNQERWGKELDEHGHLTHIETISQDESSPSDTQLLCWMAFILLADVAGQNEDPNAPPSQYYSEIWVDMVIRRLNSDGLPWASIPREVLYKPTHVTLMMRSLYRFLQTAYQYKRIPENKITEVFNLFRDMGDRMELVRWNDAVNFAWARDVDPLFEEISKQEEERERAASEVMVAIPVDAEQEMAPELSYLVDGLESLKNKERRAAASDADKLLALLHNASIEPGFQLLALDFLGYVLMDLPAQEVTRIVTSQSAAHMPHLLQFTMWKVDIDLRTVEREDRQLYVDDSQPRLELRRIWLQHSDRLFHVDFQQHWFVEYLSAWHDINPKQSESYVKTVGMLLGRAPDVWLPILEQDGHVKRVATLMGTPAAPTPDKAKVVQWIAFRVFLAMWRIRADGSTPEAESAKEYYVTRHCHRALSTFFSSLKSQSRLDHIQAALPAQDALPPSMTPMDFVIAGSTYLQEMATKQKIDADVIDGYELCTDPMLCGASRAKNYSGELDWRQDIALWTEKVAKLRR